MNKQPGKHPTLTTVGLYGRFKQAFTAKLVNWINSMKGQKIIGWEEKFDIFDAEKQNKNKHKRFWHEGSKNDTHNGRWYTGRGVRQIWWMVERESGKKMRKLNYWKYDGHEYQRIGMGIKVVDRWKREDVKDGEEILGIGEKKDSAGE